MRSRFVLASAGGLVILLAAAGSAWGDSGPPPPPPPFSGTPLPGIPPPCPPTGCPTATPTITPTPTATSTPTATATSTPTPTSTPIPLFVQLKLAHKTVRVNQKQKITVTTLPAASVKIVVAFPNHSKKTHRGTAGSDGVLTWAYKQPGGRVRSYNHKAKVNITVTDAAGMTKKTSKKYTIS